MHYSFLLLDGFTMHAFSSAAEVLRIASRVLGAPDITYSAISLDGKPVAASNGFEVVPTQAFDKVDKNSTVVVIAGADAANIDYSETINRLRYLARQGTAIWGLSSGVIVLAQAGFLDNKTAAAHWEDMPYLRQNYPKIALTGSLFERHTRLATCAGGSAAADLFLSEIAQQRGQGFVSEITARLLLENTRDGRLSQRKPLELRYYSSNQLAFNTIKLMRKNLFEPRKIADLAAMVQSSQRQLERVFLTEFGETPYTVYLHLRLEDARQEVLSARRRISDIALDYGFSMGSFSKSYARIYGLSPTQDRKQSQTAKS